MREIIYYVASTVDGFIARDDGSFDTFPFDAAYGSELVARYPETFPAPYRRQIGNTAENRVFDTVLMGRATYEVGSGVPLFRGEMAPAALTLIDHHAFPSGHLLLYYAVG